MANLITIGRLPLLALVVIMIYCENIYSRVIATFLILLLFLMDWLDGFVARNKGETSYLGGVLDIAVDRVVECTFWVVFANINLVPIWAPLLVISRGIIVDSIRSYALSKGETTFGMMRSRVGNFLVSSRFMRGFYGASKALVFCLLPAHLVLISILHGSGYENLTLWLKSFINLLVVLVVFLCVLRGIPVIFEARRFVSGRE